MKGVKADAGAEYLFEVNEGKANHDNHKTT